PPGFCVTTAAFDVQVGSLPGVRSAIARLPDDGARSSIVAAVEAADLEPSVAGAVRAATARLAARELDPPLRTARFAAPPSVRSSCAAGARATASFAGLLETEPGVAVAGLPGGIGRCGASLWSVPALFSRTRRGLPLDGGAMAVVVQWLVPASAAAVVFTRHP